MTVKRSPLHVCCIFLYMVSVLTCLRMAQVQAEICSIHVRATNWIKINLSCHKYRQMQSNTTINICIAKRCSYIASLNNDMFRPLYRPSSDCTFSYFKANYAIYNVFLFCFCQRHLVLRPANSTQTFLGIPVSTSECWDGSQVSKLLLHASHVALPT